MAFIKQRNKTETYSFSDIGKPEQILITLLMKALFLKKSILLSYDSENIYVKGNSWKRRLLQAEKGIK
ncbi:hypothetical protein QFZ28_003855 [Neobacillus niacini]|uniref:hypothetical protein n=1 Tax=Neobacillus niacini TaxID=86668 RepID=UPI00278A6689|nr:hypothetical protein [Neobacillus niacini]MDQ1003455.1 hypothetical protein [Neobacillus niacini]